MNKKIEIETQPRTPHAPERALQDLPVYCGTQFRVHNGANLGDPIAPACDIELTDVYQLTKDAPLIPMTFSVNDTAIHIAEGSPIGTIGAQVHLDCVITLMSVSGETVEAIIMVEVDQNLFISNTYVLPLTPLKSKHDYTVILIDLENARTRLAEAACVSFTRGTYITLNDGSQRPIEDLTVSDRVLTRNNGPQQIRWIGQQTVRATGSFAPILIKKGTLNNERDLTVSPNHRMFIYQRKNQIQSGRSEVLVKAKLLINGDTIVQSDGGFVEYYQLLFDNHEIIYAEGIAAESMLADTQVKPYLPESVQTQFFQDQNRQTPTHAVELRDGTLDPTFAASVLRASSAK